MRQRVTLKHTLFDRVFSVNCLVHWRTACLRTTHMMCSYVNCRLGAKSRINVHAYASGWLAYGVSVFAVACSGFVLPYQTEASALKAALSWSGLLLRIVLRRKAFSIGRRELVCQRKWTWIYFTQFPNIMKSPFSLPNIDHFLTIFYYPTFNTVSNLFH